jgi:hypothetical protein
MSDEDRSEETVGSAGPVVAWRRWRLRPDASGLPRLSSAHEDHVWDTPNLEAECDPARTWSFRLALDDEEHSPPAEGCRCGVYAYRTPELARPMGPGAWVHGQVQLAGPMFLTDTGFRARTATIDGPLVLTVECVGGDDLYSPTRCFGVPEEVRFGGRAYYPLCSSHQLAAMHRSVDGSLTIAEFSDSTASLAANLQTVIAVPASV